jgi:hypothetical protein
MPPVIALLGTLAPIITAAGAAATVGDTIYNATQGSGGGSGATQTADAQAQQTLQAQQAASQKQQAINAQVSNAQERTGGSVDTPGLTNFATLLAGYGGQGGAAPTPFGPTTTGASTSSTPGLQDALTQLSSSGGSSPPPTANFSGGS